MAADGIKQHGRANNLRRHQQYGFRFENRTTLPDEHAEGLTYYDSQAGQKHLYYCVDDSVPVYARVLRGDTAETVTGLWTFNPATGDLPFALDSSAIGKVDYLNADRVDNYHASQSVLANTLATRNGDGTVSGADPTSNEHFVTLGYVTNLIDNYDPKDPCEAATTGNIDVSSAPSTFDGYTASSGDRIFVWKQVAGEENGIRIFQGVGNPMPRSSDADEDNEVTSGMQTFIRGGNTHTGAIFMLKTADPIVLDTDALEFVQVGGNTLYSDGRGLTKSGNKFHAIQAGAYSVGDLVYADSDSTLTFLTAEATGKVLKSGGLTTAPLWGKVDLTTDIAGILPVDKGGSGTDEQFTAGSVIFAGASGVYKEDNVGLFFDGAADRLCIGGNNPTEKLSVILGDISLTTGYGIHAKNGGNENGIFFSASTAGGSSNFVRLYTDGSERFRVDYLGNAGLGSNAPSTDGPAIAQRLVVKGAGSTGITVSSPDANNATYNFGSVTDNDYAWLQGYYNTGSPFVRGSILGTEVWRFAAGGITLSGDLDFSGAGRDILFVDNSGAALEFKEGANLYQRFVTTNGSERIDFYKKVYIDSLVDGSSNSVLTSESGVLEKRAINEGVWTTNLGANRLALTNSSGQLTSSGSFTYSGNRIGLGGPISNIAGLRVFAVDDAVDVSSTTYEVGIIAKATGCYNIATGVTDSGYRIGATIEAFVDDADFAGTLQNQYSLLVQHGAYTSTSGSEIVNSHGVFIESYTNANTTIQNLWGLYQESSAAKNYFGGNVGFGTTDIENWSSSYRAIEFGASAIMADLSTTGIRLISNAYYDGAYKYKTTDEASRITLGVGGYIKFSVAESGTMDTVISWTDALTINNDGTLNAGVLPANTTSSSVLVDGGSGKIEKRTISTTAWEGSFSVGAVPFGDSNGNLKDVGSAFSYSSGSSLFNVNGSLKLAATGKLYFNTPQTFIGSPSGSNILELRGYDHLTLETFNDAVADQYISFAPRLVEAMRIVPGGNVGFGTTDIENWSSSYRAIEFAASSIMASNGGDEIDINSNCYFDTSWKYKKTGAAANFFVSNGVFYFRVAASGTIDTGPISFTNALTINNNGTLTFGVMGSGAGNSVLTEESGDIKKRTIDSRVWGSSLVGQSGGGIAGKIPKWSDANTLVNSNISESGSIVTITGSLAITSTALVSNLNADRLDGQHGSFYTTATNIGGLGNNRVVVTEGTGKLSSDSALLWDGNGLAIGASVSSLLTLGGGTTTKAPLKFTAGPLLTTPQVGAMEFSNETEPALYFTRKVGARKRVCLVHEEDIGDGSNSTFTITHDLGAKPVSVVGTFNATGEEFSPDWDVVDDNTISVTYLEVLTVDEVSIRVAA